MKGITGAVIAAFVVGVAAQPHIHGHNHQHLHRRLKEESGLEKRATTVTTVVPGPVETEYVLDGKKIDGSMALKGISNGDYLVMGTSTPTFSAPPDAVSTSKSIPHGGQFIEQKSSSTSESSSSTPPAKPTAASVPETGGGVDADFPSGTIPCSHFPSDYGAVPVPWAADGGWTTLMAVGKWVKGLSFDNIAQPKGTGCTPGCMCSYACGAGFQKTQWPEGEQGATGQSVGGLYCNSDGMLELTRPSHTKLCERGAGGVFVRNELSKNAAICRTDYPGNEAMTIPLNTLPGNTYPLTNPVSATYYQWQGKKTTAQYYVNNEGLAEDQACVWDSTAMPGEAGNWAPTNIGVGKADDGITYLAIFQNLPTSHAVLNFNIEIEGDVSGECWLRNGEYAKPNGCTVGIKEGGTATIVFKH